MIVNSTNKIIGRYLYTPFDPMIVHKRRHMNTENESIATTILISFVLNLFCF